ncbi:ribonuclease P [Candidatus Woesearchaeota archaeon]|nr:ribonuclease P [Candidatus Woesearchaeota archaeon]
MLWRKKLKDREKKQALADVNALFDKALEVHSANPTKADDLVRKARRMAMKHQIKLKSSQKRLFCKHCYKLLVPSKNSRIRITKGKLVQYCDSCKKFRRRPL